jgi:integrase
VRGKGEGSVYRVPKDTSQPLKYWTAVVELPSEPGKRRRKVLRSKDKKVVLAKLAELKRELETRGDLPSAAIDVQTWFTYWLDNVAVNEIRPKSFAGYRSTTNQHIIPGLGARTKLDKVTPTTVRQVHQRILDRGLTSTYALNAHRIMSRALEIAVREGHIGRNPAKLVDAPRKEVKQLDVLDLDEAIHLLEHVSNLPDGARWATGLLTGARRGEVIGIEADRVGEYIDLSWQMQRLKLTDDGIPIAPADFEWRHVRGGLYLTRPKSAAGTRIIPLVDPLRTILTRHIAAMEPNEWGLVFTEDGRPRDPDRDTKAWNRLLAETGIQRAARLHDLRHTAVDLLYLAGIDEDIIVEIVGHSTRAMTRGYKSRANQARLTVAMQQLGALLAPPAA